MFAPPIRVPFSARLGYVHSSGAEQNILRRSSRVVVLEVVACTNLCNGYVFIGDLGREDRNRCRKAREHVETARDSLFYS